MRILVSRRATGDLKPLSPVVRRRIRDAIAKLADWPRTQADVKALQGREGFRLRVGDYRVLFHVEVIEQKETLVIDRISPRGNAYKR